MLSLANERAGWIWAIRSALDTSREELSGAARFCFERLQYATFISSRYRYFYCETPKCACTTTKFALWQIERLGALPDRKSVHVRPTDDPRLSAISVDADLAHAALFGDVFVRFCVVRDPAERLFSAFQDKIVHEAQQNEFWWKIRNSIAVARGVPENHIDFEHFIEFVRRQPDRKRNPHWMSQHRCILADGVSYDVMVRQSHYAEDMHVLFERLEIPRSLRPDFSIRYNSSGSASTPVPAKLRSRIQQAYEKDYALMERTGS